MAADDIQAQTPDGVTHSFPAGTPDAVVDKAIKGYLSTKANGVDLNDLQSRTMQQARQQLPSMQREGDTGGGGVPSRETGIVPPTMPKPIAPGTTFAQDATRTLGPDAKWVGGGIGGALGGVPGAMLGGAAGEATNQLLQHTFTPEAAPKSSLGATGRMALASGQTGLAEVGGKVAGKLLAPVARRVLGTPASEAEKAAAQRAFNPPPKGQEAFQQNLEGARPYLGGGNVKSYADFKAAAPEVQNEIWKPYSDVMDKIGNETVQGPEGETTYSALEARRKELSAQLQALNSKDPVAAQTMVQQGKTHAGLLDEQSAIENLLDERMRQEGLNSPLLRKTWGNIEGLERLTSGRNNLLEEPQPYGLSRLTLNPRKGFGIPAMIDDISAGRPWTSAKPTDAGIREGLQSSAEKPTFQTTTTPQPIGPQPAPPGPSGPPPPVQPQFALEGIGRPTNANIASQGRVPSAQVTQLPTEHPGNGDYAGLLPGPPAPFQPPPPRPPVPQVGQPPSMGFPPTMPDTMWTGRATPPAPTWEVPGRSVPSNAPGLQPASVELQSPTVTTPGNAGAGPNSFRTGIGGSYGPVAPSSPPTLPSTTGAPPPSGPSPAASGTPSSSSSAPPTLPPIAPPAPINPQELADFTQILRSHGYQGPITADNINDLMRQANAIRSNAAPNRVDAVSPAIEARRATLTQPKRR